MYKVVSEIRLNKYIILSFDKPIIESAYSKIVIEGREFKIVPMYDFPGIAIESPDSFIGKKVEFK